MAPEDDAGTPAANGPDAIFADPRLAQLYDVFDGPRTDLPFYLGIARELGARRVLDVGCGTGSFALLAAAAGLDVTGVDPALASLDVARVKPCAEQVTWHGGTVDTAPFPRADLALMTGNVAQVFLDDEDWLATLRAVRDRLRPEGHLVHETRRLEARAWERWAADRAVTSAAVPGVGVVHHRHELLQVDLPFVSFRQTYTFPDGSEVSSDSTLRFRDDEQTRATLADAGFEVVEARDAPDRPGQEHVYVSRVRP